MGKYFVLAVICALFLVHCGGDATTSAFAQDAGGDLGGGSEVASGFKDAAITGAGGNIAVDAGFAANNTVIAIPSGFTASQCKFTSALATLDGKSISAQASIDHDTGRVICEKVVQERVEIPPEVKDCTASYTIICTK